MITLMQKVSLQSISVLQVWKTSCLMKRSLWEYFNLNGVRIDTPVHGEPVIIRLPHV